MSFVPFNGEDETLCARCRPGSKVDPRKVDPIESIAQSIKTIKNVVVTTFALGVAAGLIYAATLISR